MDTKLILTNPAEIETECLVAVVLDHGEKQKNEPKLAVKNAALEKAAAEVTAALESTGKLAEAVLVHRPQGI